MTTDRTEMPSGAGTADRGGRSEPHSLVYSDAVAATRIVIALEVDADALRRRFPAGWEVAPYAGEHPRDTTLRGANLVLPFHEVTAIDDPSVPPGSHPQLRYIGFVAPGRHETTGEAAHIHFRLYTSDHQGYPGKFRNTRHGRFTRHHGLHAEYGQLQVRDVMSVDAEDGRLEIAMTYQPNGLGLWMTADEPDLCVRSAVDPAITRWYKEDLVHDIVRSRPLDIDRMSELSIDVTVSSLADLFGGGHEVIGVIINPTYIRRVFVPAG